MTHGVPTASCVAYVRGTARTPPWTPCIAVQHLTTALFLSKPVRPLPLFPVVQALTGVLVYFGVLLLLGETDVRSFLRGRKALPVSMIAR